MPSDLPIALSVAASPALQERGCVQTIGLEEMKTELGPLGQAQGDCLDASGISLLAHKLSPTGCCTRPDGARFVVSRLRPARGVSCINQMPVVQR